MLNLIGGGKIKLSSPDKNPGIHKKFNLTQPK